ncbi:hypothetical protein ABNX41_11655, partial [Rhodobacteraceae bacterium PA1-206B]
MGGNGVVALAGVAGAIGCDTADLLPSRDLVEKFGQHGRIVAEYRRAFNETTADANAERNKVKVEKKIANMLIAIQSGFYNSSMKADMVALKDERSSLTRFLATSPEPPALRLHPRMSDLYREEIADLAEALNQPELRPQATELLLGLTSEVRMVPAPGIPGGHEIELVGELARILNLAEADMTKPPHGARAGVGSRSDTVVAGACGHWRHKSCSPLF